MNITILARSAYNWIHANRMGIALVAICGLLGAGFGILFTPWYWDTIVNPPRWFTVAQIAYIIVLAGLALWGTKE